MNKQIQQLITKYNKDATFTKVAPTQAMLEEVKKQLGFPVPDQFLEYLNTYSYGGFGFEILGIGFDNSICFLEETLDYRSYGLPENLLVVENCDEWLYCIDVNTHQVVSWSFEDGARVEFPDFDTFLLQEIQNAIENM